MILGIPCETLTRKGTSTFMTFYGYGKWKKEESAWIPLKKNLKNIGWEEEVHSPRRKTIIGRPLSKNGNGDTTSGFSFWLPSVLWEG
jgi:hypothetical protein